ncbi:phenylalanine 2-monooxygenase precursor-like isoform X1 [Bradysia coprophila]|uniref:phenylalanine 2-monooxygenase precursor-like isoform X1 n=1 Tax=Bradysia coprophila TaxID=38358 RepID=UPI00187D99E4|nr:phenylalanine 2-monooxygenase precursor-like isoform X1 [Bradysia coprophila]XP_037050882.1 phenylalanine 2-monooxygenase precursor-like isoform X1 [Bradysia coprophila]
MGISIIPSALFYQPGHYKAERTLSEVAREGKYYRHPDSARISYPLVAEKPLGSINKSINVAIIGGGAAAISALYELSNIKDSDKNIRVTLYESDHDHFVHVPPTYVVRTAGLKAGRVSAAVSSDVPVPENVDHAVYEIGAMRFPEIAGLMWHYASILYGTDTRVSVFPNPGTVATELLHGDHVDRFASGEWLNNDSPTKKVVEVIRYGLVGQSQGENTSLFPINGKDPAKISAQLKDGKTTDEELKKIDEQWKVFANKYDNVTLASAVKQVITERLSQLPDVPGLHDNVQKINYYVELFGTVGFGTGGFKSVFNMSILETMRLLLWDYSNEYMLPVTANVAFLKKFYEKSIEKNPNVRVELARVCDVAHLDKNPNGSTLVVFYRIGKDGKETPDPQKEVYDYVLLATTPRQTSSMISRIGFSNFGERKVPLGDHGRRLSPDEYEGFVRPALILSENFEAANAKLFSAVSNVHMVCCSKIFASVKKADFDKYAPEFSDKGKVKAIVADCGLGSSYVVPTTILNDKMKITSEDYYSFLISYAWEDDSKKLQHNFGKYPLNIEDTKQVTDAIINRTQRYVTDPVDNSYKPWWFGEALSKCKLEDPLSYDWTTFNSAGAFKLDNAGDHYNSHLLFCYNNHALKPALKNKFFLANCSYSHLGGWLEGAFMSAVNAVCGLIVAANDGDKNALSVEARIVVDTLDKVAENID